MVGLHGELVSGPAVKIFGLDHNLAVPPTTLSDTMSFLPPLTNATGRAHPVRSIAANGIGPVPRTKDWENHGLAHS